MVDLRPLTLGEIIDRSASFWRSNWKALFKLFLGSTETCSTRSTRPPTRCPSCSEFGRARLRNQGTLEQLTRRFRAWLGSFFESRGAETYSGVTRFLVLVAAFVVAGWATLRVWSQRRPARGATVTTGQAPIQKADPAAHLARGRQKLATDPRAALRDGLLGLLCLLEQRRLAQPDRVQTNLELARELPSRGANPELAQTVDRLLGWYDRSFYSLAPIATAEALAFLEDIERLA